MKNIEHEPTKTPSQEVIHGLQELVHLRMETEDQVNEEVFKRNQEIMNGNAPNQMSYAASHESWGGNAGVHEIGGIRLTHAALNCMIDTDTGEIHAFTNYPEQMQEISKSNPSIRLFTFMKALGPMKFTRESITHQVPEGWTRPDRIVEIKSFQETHRSDKPEITKRAAINLQRAIDAYNNEVIPLQYDPTDM